MANPLPGMNPYLENRRYWNDFHTRLMTYMSNALQPQLQPRYVARLEERVYVQILDREQGLRLVTVIEVLSPTNKEPNTKGRELYLFYWKGFLCDGDAVYWAG